MGNIFFNSMSECIDICCSFQCWRYIIYYVSVNKCYLWDIMWINVNKFVLFFFVSDYVVNGYFCCSVCCGGDCQNWYIGFIGWGKFFQVMYIGKFWVVVDNVNCFISILWRIIINSDQVICVVILEYIEFFFDDSNCWVGYYVVVNCLCQFCSIYFIGYFCYYVVLYQCFIGDDQCFLIIMVFYFIG